MRRHRSVPRVYLSRKTSQAWTKSLLPCTKLFFNGFVWNTANDPFSRLRWATILQLRLPPVRYANYLDRNHGESPPSKANIDARKSNFSHSSLRLHLLQSVHSKGSLSNCDSNGVNHTHVVGDAINEQWRLLLSPSEFDSAERPSDYCLIVLESPHCICMHIFVMIVS